jgi:serpin B
MKTNIRMFKRLAGSLMASYLLVGLLASCQDATSDDADKTSESAVATSASGTTPSTDEAKADEAKADEAKADEAKADEAKADEAKGKFDPSGIVLTPSQRQKAQWALVGRLLAEKDPTTLSPTQADLAMSPTSLINALQALWWGTRGETALELAQLFDAKPDKDQPAPVGEAKPDKGADKTAALGGSVNLSMGSALWFNEAFPVKEAYRKLLESRGSGAAEAVDWSQTESAIATVNQWCAKATDGKIKTLFEPGDIRPPVAFVLASVISFKGSWSQAFDAASTRGGDFSLLNGDKFPAAYLTSTRKTPHAVLDDGTQLLELPFGAGKQRFVAVLPPKAGAEALSQLEKQVAAKMPEWLAKLTETEVAISLPKFDVTVATDPVAALQALGVKKIFSDKLADFSGASDSRGLKLDVIRHQAMVSIDEKGAEAAGATGASVTLKNLQKTPEFRADRPFLFFILGDDGDVLFAGRVAAPKAGGAVSAGIEQPAL